MLFIQSKTTLNLKKNMPVVKNKEKQNKSLAYVHVTLGKYIN